MSTSVSLHICACAHFVKHCLFFCLLYIFIYLFIYFSTCWAWQMELGSKWHSYKATPGGDGLATATSVAIRTAALCVRMGAHVLVRVCPTANRSVGTPSSVWVIVPTWILCEKCQKSQKTHQLQDAKEEKRCGQLRKKSLAEPKDLTLLFFLFVFLTIPSFPSTKHF